MKNNSNKLDNILLFIKKLIPRKVFSLLSPWYHFILANIAALVNWYPGRKIHVIAITGTKGKSSTTEYVNAVLEAGGYKTAILSTIRFKIGDHNYPNKYKMTMPGRFFVQNFLKEAVDNKCQFAIIEMTSEGAKNWRHLWTFPDTLIFTNLSPEHVESHGSFNNYLKCKLRLAKAVEKSGKPFRRIIANVSDKHGAYFLIYDIEKKIPYYEEDAHNIDIATLGDFNKLNAHNAYLLGKELNINEEKILSAIKNLKHISGRMERVDIEEKNNINYSIYIDYAHTVDSLEKMFQTFKDKKIIHIFGSDGGGRDTAKRPLLGELSDKYSQNIILTEENPYNDNNFEIMNSIKFGIKRKELDKDLFIINNRREAIRKGIEIADKSNDENTVLLITGKGSEPYIVRANNQKEEWLDVAVVKELIEERK